MPSKFDEYLSKGGFTDQDRAAAQDRNAQDVKSNSAPTPIADQSKSRPDAPQPAISEERKAGIESTQQSSPAQPVNEESKAQADQALGKSEEAPEEPKQGVEAQYPSSDEKGEDKAPEQEQQQDIDRWEDDGGR